MTISCDICESSLELSHWGQQTAVSDGHQFEALCVSGAPFWIFLVSLHLCSDAGLFILSQHVVIIALESLMALYLFMSQDVCGLNRLFSH